LEIAMWEKEMTVAREAAEAAGRVLSRFFGQVSHIVKKGDIDIVTEADLHAEKTILEILHQNFPQDTILSEEAGKHEQVSSRTWLIDPLDGTTNFAHGCPFFATSIALELEKDIVLGVVFNPQMNEYFEAAKGMGAYLNKMPISTSEISNLKESLLATGFAYDVHQNAQTALALFSKMLVRAQGVRRPGSAAIDLCYVAAGRFDGFWEVGLKPWDTAAGAIIVNEAGGKVTTIDGGAYSPYIKSILAANPFIYDHMRKVLNE
jgi:myo-inositol-1(or 4)-monophosphatase